MESEKRKNGLKERAIRELKVFWIIAVYLAFVFGAFATYKRLILRQVGISYLEYGAGVVEALIVAKVILIGEAFSLGKRLEHRPLILVALFKAVAYGVLVGIFGILEHLIEGLIHGKDWASVVRELFALPKDEVLAHTLVIVFTFIPFFAFWETDRVLGEGKLLALFFQRRAPLRLSDSEK